MSTLEGWRRALRADGRRAVRADERGAVRADGRRRSGTLSVRAALAVTLAALTVLTGTTSASADPGESIPSFDSKVVVDASGDLHVTETLEYVFVGSSHHGIYRDLRTRFTYDPDRSGSNQVRSYPVSDVEVSSPTGASSSVDVSESGSVTHLRIGDADKPVSGRQTYVISYTVAGAFNRIDTESTLAGSADGDNVPPHDELYWNITGSEWEVPIQRALVTVTAPAAATDVLCFRGDQGSTDRCTGTAGATSTFGADDLQPGQGMSIVLAYPHAMVSEAGPVLEHTGPARILDVSPVAAGGAAALLIALVGGMSMLVRRRGRDAAYVGLTPGLLPVGGEGASERVVTRHPKDVAVQFSPPKGLRPGQIGTLIDERANTVDVTATIVDLAVRGFLTIEEVVDEDRPGKEATNWRLVVRDPAPAEDLESYELALMQAIFKGRNEVTMDDLKDTFASDMKATQSRLYDDVTQRGWFRGNPQTVRSTYRTGGFVLSALGFALIWFGGGLGFGSVSLFAAALFVGGGVVAWLAGRMPARTATGSAVLTQANGFRTYLETAEADQIRFEEGQDVFSRYLPYAIIFGVADRWAKVFEDLARSGAAVSQPSWYVGGGPMWSYYALGHSMSSFSTTANSALVSTPSSSGSSGFSGGGGGGGGGGSW